MMPAKLPNLLETTLGVFLHDIGKFVQRAYGTIKELPETTRNMESVLLPVYQGRYSHKHVLGTEFFFDWLKEHHLRFPRGIDLQAVRNVAVFHHKPESAVSEIGPIGWLCAEADRLSSGMDRKKKDEAAEQEDKAWDKFIRTPLITPFAAVDLGLGQTHRAVIPLQELVPGENLMPRKEVDSAGYQALYNKLWKKLQGEMKELFRLENPDLFGEGLLSLSERYFFTVPSSTIDEPDISLHDHNRTAAAIAAAMYRWHERDGSLEDEAKIKDRDLPKYRFLAGDLSGIQSSLFLLANQQVKGVNKILRARSFLLTMMMEAAVLACRQALDLPVFSVIQNAGGRFLLLVPNTDGVGDTVKRLQGEIDNWMLERYYGEVAMNLTLGEPFPGSALLLKDKNGEPAGVSRLPEVMRRLSAAIDASKIRAFDGTLRTIHKQADYSEFSCAACSVRPGKHRIEEETDSYRCDVCEAEYRLGGALVKSRYLSWEHNPDREPHNSINFFSGLQLRWYEHSPGPERRASLSSLLRLYRGPETGPGPFALRFLSTYVPVLSAEEASSPLYERFVEDAAGTEPGDLKTFGHLAADALEPDGNRDYIGQPFLAVLKADVDRLGLIFSFGLRRRSPEPNKQGHEQVLDVSLSRSASLSRMMDLFFTGYLYDFLRREFASTYTVYAGGDDLLLIGPWRQTLELAAKLREKFNLWTGHNPNISLSAGVELMKANHPVTRAARAADQRLEEAKNNGRNKVCAIDTEPMSWTDFAAQLERAKTLHGYLRDGTLSNVFVYKILEFDRERRRAEPQRADAAKPRSLDLQAASWRARWGYHLARNVRDNKNLGDEQERRQAMAFLNELLGLDAGMHRLPGAVPSPRTAVSIALYRNRKPTERS